MLSFRQKNRLRFFGGYLNIPRLYVEAWRLKQDLLSVDAGCYAERNGIPR